MAGASAGVADSLEEVVRCAVREELASQSGRPGTQSLVQRTRQLINASASSASRTLALGFENNDARSSSGDRNGRVETVPNQTNKRPNSVPSHSLRFKKRGKLCQCQFL